MRALLDETIRSTLPAHPGVHQVMSNGKKVWVNGPDGASIARLTLLLGKQVSIDIHKSVEEQRRTGDQCLDCRHDVHPHKAWEYFTDSLLRNFGLVIKDKHRPDWATSPNDPPTAA